MTSLSTDQAYAVLQAGSAVAALAVLDADAAVDVLLTDFAMPGMEAHWMAAGKHGKGVTLSWSGGPTSRTVLFDRIPVR